ncbi:MAG: hypothetical protein ACYC64_20455 [Armatimonadota bacterium]
MMLLGAIAVSLVVGVPGSVSVAALPMGANEPQTDIVIEMTTPQGALPWEVEKKEWHPPHRVKVWTTRYKHRILRVTQLPRCEHIETLITYNGRGETIARAKKRLGGIAACSGSFHNTKSMFLADFLQKDGEIFSSARTGRCFVCINEDGILDISRDYCEIKGKSGVSALALGQRLIPLQRDGFSVGFMNRVTDRMAIGVNDYFIFIVQGKSDIWRLAAFMRHRLPCKIAVNSDGGHVVRGKAPVHIVFRWKKTPQSSSNAAKFDP